MENKNLKKARRYMNAALHGKRWKRPDRRETAYFAAVVNFDCAIKVIEFDQFLRREMGATQ